MSESFKAGDVCEIIDHPDHRPEHRKYIGAECTILRIAKFEPYFDCEISLPAHGPAPILARFEGLRKKRPPPKREQVSTWDDVIVWRPKETVHV